MGVIKLIVFDLDNTTLDDNKNLDSNLKETLFKLKNEKGIEYTIASGRNEEVLEKYVSELNITIPYITNNGGNIYQNHKCLFYNCFNQKYNNYILKLLYDNNFTFRAFCIEGIYGNKTSTFFESRTAVFEKQVIEYNPEKDYGNYHFYKITLDANNNIELIDNVIKQIDKFKDIIMLKADRNIYCINNHTANKGNAVKKVCELLKINIDEVMTFGDDYNDLTMLLSARIGVVPNNASEEIKTKVKYICKNDNNHNAVSNFLKEYFKL